MDLQAARNLSFVFISHDLGVVKTNNDHVLVLYAGDTCLGGGVIERSDAPALATGAAA